MIDWENATGDEIVTCINEAMAEVRRSAMDSTGSTMIELKATDRRYMTVPDIIITKPKQPNFAQFQNNFKRRGR